MKKKISYAMLILFVGLFLFACADAPSNNRVIGQEGNALYESSKINTFYDRFIDREAGVVCYYRAEAIFCLPIGQTFFR